MFSRQKRTHSLSSAFLAAATRPHHTDQPPWPSSRACEACRCVVLCRRRPGRRRERERGAASGVRCAPAATKRSTALLTLPPPPRHPPQVFISDIRACQNREQEAARVDKELGKIRKKFATGTAVTGAFVVLARGGREACVHACVRERGVAVPRVCGRGRRGRFSVRDEAPLLPAYFATQPPSTPTHVQTTTKRSTSGSCSTSTCWATTSSLATARRPTWWPPRAMRRNRSATWLCPSCSPRKTSSCASSSTRCAPTWWGAMKRFKRWRWRLWPMV